MFNEHYHGTSLVSLRTLFNVVQYYVVELVNVNFLNCMQYCTLLIVKYFSNLD